MNKKIKRLSLTTALIHLLQNDYCLAKDKSLSNIFNEQNNLTGQYGTNQLDFYYHFNNLIKDPLILDEVQKYFPRNKFDSDEEAMFFYNKYFKVIADCGCGYTAVINSIFEYFNGREEDFLNTFNFPMYNMYNDNKIDYNYELLVLKFFNYVVLESHAEDYCLDDVIKYFEKDYYSYKLQLFQSNPDFQKKLPKDFHKYTKSDWDNWNKYTEERNNQFKILYNKWLEAENVYKNFGLPIEIELGDIKGFLKQYNIDINVDIKRTKKFFSINDILACHNFTLYKRNENGDIIDTIDHVSSHYVYISDITEDGKIIVSSWGKEYLFDNEESSWTYRLTLKYK